MSDSSANSVQELREQLALAREHRDAYARDLAEARRRADDLFAQAQEWQARHQGVAQLWEALQTSHGQLQEDYRRLQSAHADILLAHGQLLLAQQRTANDIRRPLTTNTNNQGDAGIEFTAENFCDRPNCPTTPPHRHITLPPPLKGQAPVDHPSPREERLEYPPDLAPTISSADQGTQGISFETYDGVTTIDDVIAERRKRIQATLDDQPSGTENDGFPSKKNPNIEKTKEILDKARIAQKFADASGEAGPFLVVPPEVAAGGQPITDSNCTQCHGSDETTNSPDKSTEER